MGGFEKLYNKLNKEQKHAVDAIDGPVLVVAGPGTGKTQVLTMRIANILLKTDTSPDSILALTFTDSGVRAMRERLVSIIGTSAYYVNIHTFHSFASDIIRANPDEFIISTQIEPLSDLERIRILTEVFDELDLKAIKPFNAPYFYLRTAISKIQDLKREGVDIEEYTKFIKDSSLDDKEKNKNKELLKVYELYQQKLTKYGRYDFEDMINFVIEKFKTSPTLLQKYQEIFQYFLVDEFQDTNSAQAELLYQLSSYWEDKPNLFVVGDDDQSIYRFQGASIENIIDFNKKYPDSLKITLKNNYRSNQPIIDVAQDVISSNTLRISSHLDLDKTQKSQVESKNNKVIEFAEFSSSYTENHYIASEIKKLIDNGVEPSEIAVIYRNNADSIDISDMLSRFGLEYTLVGGENVLEAGVVVRLMHLLQVIQKIQSKDEDLDLFTLLNYEFMDVDSLDILKISRYASGKKQNFLDVLEEIARNNSKLSTLKFKEPEKLTDIYQKLTYWNELSHNITFINFLEQVMEESGFLNWVLNHAASYEYLNKINSFLSEVKRLNQSNKNLTLSDFLNYIELMKINGIAINESTLDLQTDAVKLTTAHRAKGLEFKYVFIPKFTDKKWSNVVVRNLVKLPDTILDTVKLGSRKEEKKHQEEDDRRLFYVVLTRAKEKIFITSAKTYQTSMYTKTAIPSMFARELPEDYMSTVNIKKYEENASEILRQILTPKVTKVETSMEEKEFLTESLQKFKLSATALNTYIECPYKFKLTYLFKTPRKTAKPLALGSAIHKSLELAYKEMQKGKSVDMDFLIKSFKTGLEKEILNEIEYKNIYDEGISILKIYYQTYADEFKGLGERELFIEKFLGWGWSKPMLDGHIHLQGKIDKMEIVDEDKKQLRITDYKTGRPKSRNDILGKTKYSKGDALRQLQFYKLLIDLDNSLPFTVKEVELDFTGNRSYQPKKEIFEISDKDIDNLKGVIRKTSQNISDLKFERTTNYTDCHNCRFKYHCWPDGIPADNPQLSLM